MKQSFQYATPTSPPKSIDVYKKIQPSEIPYDMKMLLQRSQSQVKHQPNLSSATATKPTDKDLAFHIESTTTRPSDVKQQIISLTPAIATKPINKNVAIHIESTTACPSDVNQIISLTPAIATKPINKDVATTTTDHSESSITTSQSFGEVNPANTSNEATRSATPPPSPSTPQKEIPPPSPSKSRQPNDYATRLPTGWKSTIAEIDQAWIGEFFLFLY